MPAPSLILALLLTVCFTLSTCMQPRAVNWNGNRAKSDDILAIVFGDARRLFANHFLKKADMYFHSGYYPSVFDEAGKKEIHIAEEASAGQHDEGEAEEEMDFLGKPHDWIERFGRHFSVTDHTHLHGEMVREILPWLRVSAALDPQKVDTYTVASYWLRTQIKRPKEAEQFLRDGLRANPGNPDILYELGLLFDEDFKDVERARNIWQAAEAKLEAQESASGEMDLFTKRKILVHLSHLEEAQGNFSEAVKHLEKLDAALAKDETAPGRPEIQKLIQELKQKQVAKP